MIQMRIKGGREGNVSWQSKLMGSYYYVAVKLLLKNSRVWTRHADID